MPDESKILAAISSLEVKMDNLKDDVNRLTKVVIDGNGSLGLVTRTDRLEQSHERLEKIQETNTKGRWGILAAIIGGLIVVAGSGLLSVLIALLL